MSVDNLEIIDNSVEWIVDSSSSSDDGWEFIEGEELPKINNKYSDVGIQLAEGTYGIVFLISKNGHKFIRKVFKDNDKKEVKKELKILLAIKDFCKSQFLCLHGEYDLDDLKKNNKGYYYIDTEYIEHSEMLYDFLHNNKYTLTLNERIYIIYMYLKAICKFNEVATHYDIKTPNILISIPPNGTANVILIDYGLSCLLENDDDCHDKLKQNIGFATYFPPEIYKQRVIKNNIMESNQDIEIYETDIGNLQRHLDFLRGEISHIKSKDGNSANILAKIDMLKTVIKKYNSDLKDYEGELLSFNSAIEKEKDKHSITKLIQNIMKKINDNIQHTKNVEKIMAKYENELQPFKQEMDVNNNELIKLLEEEKSTLTNINKLENSLNRSKKLLQHYTDMQLPINEGDKLTFDAWQSGLVVYNILFCSFFVSGIEEDDTMILQDDFILPSLQFQIGQLSRAISMNESDKEVLKYLQETIIKLTDLNSYKRQSLKNVYRELREKFGDRIEDGRVKLSLRHIEEKQII